MTNLPKFRRAVTDTIAKRLTEKARFLEVIVGPRQSGKTTAVRQVLTGLKFPSHYAAADLPAPPDTIWIRKEWERARLLADSGKPAVLILDEVQKVSRWSEEVKRLWDEDRGEGRDIRVALLGSSSLSIQKGLSESLAGRFELIRLYHWNFSECKACFGWNLNQFLFFGGYPGAAPLIDDEDRWGAYMRDSLIETAISKDVLLLHPVQKPAVLRKLFLLACEYGAQVLSYQKILGQLTEAGNTTTLANYQHLLESAFLITGLEKYSGRKVRQRSSSPKWLPLNTALISALSEIRFSEARKNPAFWGRLAECAVGSYLFQEAKRLGFELFYWREGDREVDYILKRGKRLIAIEVKTGEEKNLSYGFSTFEKRYKAGRFLVVGAGGIPLEEFLSVDIKRL